jgi:hypothetical protein
MPSALPPPPPQEWKETNPFRNDPDEYLVKEPKAEELTPVQKSWNKYKDTFNFTDPDGLMLFPVTDKLTDRGESKEYISALI